MIKDYETFGSGPEEREKKIRSTLAGDIFLGFRFSQGDDREALPLLLLALGSYYKDSFSDHDKQWIGANANSLLTMFSSLRPPKVHGIVYGEVDLSTHPRIGYQFFRNEGQNLIKILGDLDQIDGDSVLPLMTTAVIKRDIHYQHNPRPMGLFGDEHGSYFREFAISGAPTNSEAFSSIFAQAGTLATGSSAPVELQSGLGELVRLWEAGHPDLSFYPAVA